ncbi:hypothetical protein [Chromohalobacter sp. 296-RDG]|uniref:hypothetical protein n=1 Tax=Chromohalobacter sp. 296-RDG TaxID=2994062 RepID=UPI0024685A22|nr:hypothetical protein [Chromohalobacter sp. 296-RDG]
MPSLVSILLFGMGLLMAGPSVAETSAAPSPSEPAVSANVNIPDGHFVTLAFHDVRDAAQPAVGRDPYAISHERLAAWFDWMLAHDWHPDLPPGLGPLTM